MKLFLAAFMLFAGTLPAAAQWLDRPWPGIPRTTDGMPDLTAPAPRGPDGQPDLTGVWNGPPPLVRLDSATLQPWVTDLVRQRQQEYYKTRPVYRCQPSGPESQRFGGWKRFLQTPTAIAILNGDLTYRVIHMDGRELEADPFPSWAGYSVGRWDGDTLVVDTTNFDPKTRYQGSRDTLHLVERYTRVDENTIDYQFTIDDPQTFTRPWTVLRPMTRVTDRVSIFEYACHGGNYAMEGILAGARAEEKAAAQAANQGSR